MTTAIVPHRELKRDFQQVANDIRDRHRDVLRELRLEYVEGGLILRGVAVAYYGKQVAFHEVKRRCGLTVLANQIVVRDRPPVTCRG
jgi:hypothetical protein